MTDFDIVKFSNNSFDFQVLSELCEREGGAVAYRKEIHSLRKQSVTLQATAAEGYDFVRWLENDKTMTDSSTYVYTPQGNADLTAVFTPKFVDVTISYNEKGGSVTGGGTGRYAYGTLLPSSLLHLPSSITPHPSSFLHLTSALSPQPSFRVLFTLLTLKLCVI